MTYPKWLKLPLPARYSPKKYAQHATLLLLAGVGYSIVFSNAIEPVISFIKAVDKTYLALAIIGLCLVGVWKVQVGMRYILWRLKPQVQDETFQYLAYSAFIVTSYVWLLAAEIVKDNYSVLALILSFVFLAINAVYTIAAYVAERLNPEDIGSPALNVLSDTPHEDEPIASQKQALAALITVLKGAFRQDGNGALAVALDGAWGDGKSSIVGMALKSPEASPYVVVRFEPWRYTTQEALVSGFYSEIGKAVEAQLPGFQMSRFDMAKFAQGFISNADKTGIVKSFFGAYKKRTDNYATKVNTHLGRHNKKLLIVIDDVDRLHDDSHVMRTLQLAQYLKCDIERSVILFIAEMERIKGAVPQRLQKSYLQKFFDMTIMVTQPTQDELVTFINDKLKILELKGDVQLQADKGLLALLRNLRGAKRVLSMLATDIENVGDNVNAQDMFFMRVMYYVYPVIYSDIRDTPSMYYAYSFDFEDRDFGIYGLSEEVFEADQVKHFEEILGSLGVMTTETKRLKVLLEDYFPHLKNAFKDPGVGKSHIDNRKLFRERRIGTREYLDRYFTYSDNVDKRHTAEDKVKEFIEGSYTKLADEKRTQEVINLYEKHGSDAPKLFFTSLLSVAEDNMNDMEDAEKAVLFRDILRTCFKVTGYLVRDNDGSLTRILSAINRLVSRDNYPAVFENIEQYMSNPSTGLRLLLYTNPTRSNQLGNLQAYSGYPEMRIKILEQVDRYYLEEGNDVFAEDTSDEGEWRFVLAQWSTSVCYDQPEALDVARRTKVNDYVEALAKDSVSQLHALIMGAFWQNDLTAGKYRFIFNVSPQPYEVDRFVKLVRQILNDTSKAQAVDAEQRKDFDRFLTQYDAFRDKEKVAAAPIVTSLNNDIAWATNYSDVGAAFSAPIKVDNYGGEADFIVNAHISGTLEDGSAWESNHFKVQGKKVAEPHPVSANDIAEVNLFISDDFTSGRLIPSITTDAKLEVTFRSGKKRTVIYKPGNIKKS